VKNILIVGAGFAGSVIARQLAEAGHKVTILESRPHIAGNCHDKVIEGIRVHTYGPHLFHTNNEEVVQFLSKFTEWIDYKHKVKAQLKDGRYVTLPANRETVEIIGKDKILDVLFRPYTRKMWKRELEELDPSILQRVPTRDDDNELYFPNDKYQMMPADGYTALFEKMLAHPLIEVKLNTRYNKHIYRGYDHVFNSMPIDEYYEFCFGKLPYRSVKFHSQYIPMNRLLPTTTVNFTHDGPYTRVTEWKSIPGHGSNDQLTILTFEEPCDYEDNNHQRFYPVKDLDGVNRARYQRYASIENKDMTFIGRCGTYLYLDMHMVISQSINIVKRYLNENITKG
jgi:UDP-galactopyranose mutase